MISKEFMRYQSAYAKIKAFLKRRRKSSINAVKMLFFDSAQPEAANSERY
jgi:hypothetical protein